MSLGKVRRLIQRMTFEIEIEDIVAAEITIVQDVLDYLAEMGR